MRGATVAVCDYTGVPDETYPAPVLQVAARVRQEVQDDPRLIVIGLSSGAQIASIVVSQLAEGDGSHICLVGMYGVYDLRPAGENTAPEWVQRAVQAYIGSLAEPALAAASPVLFACGAARARRIVLMHGTDDETTPASQSIEYAAALRECGARVSMLLYDGARHGFIGGYCNPPLAEQVDALLKACDR